MRPAFRSVSILTRPLGRMQQGRGVEDAIGYHVSILTRPLGRMQRRFPTTYSSVLTSYQLKPFNALRSQDTFPDLHESSSSVVPVASVVATRVFPWAVVAPSVAARTSCLLASCRRFATG